MKDFEAHTQLEKANRQHQLRHLLIIYEDLFDDKTYEDITIEARFKAFLAQERSFYETVASLWTILADWGTDLMV